MSVTFIHPSLWYTNELIVVDGKLDFDLLWASPEARDTTLVAMWTFTRRRWPGEIQHKTRYHEIMGVFSLHDILATGVALKGGTRLLNESNIHRIRPSEPVLIVGDQLDERALEAICCIEDAGGIIAGLTFLAEVQPNDTRVLLEGEYLSPMIIYHDGISQVDFEGRLKGHLSGLVRPTL